MRRLSVLFFLLISTLSFSQNYWSQSQIDDIFLKIDKGLIEQAKAQLQSSGSTPYDFGLDLLAQGRGLEAEDWFLEMISNDVNGQTAFYKIGLAWTYRSLGNSSLAMSEIQEMLQSGDLLVQARSNYLQGLLYIDLGETFRGRQHLEQSLTLYNHLGKKGGADMCSNVLQHLSRAFGKSSGVTTGLPSPPPRDDRDA